MVGSINLRLRLVPYLLGSSSLLVLRKSIAAQETRSVRFVDRVPEPEEGRDNSQADGNGLPVAKQPSADERGDLQHL